MVAENNINKKRVLIITGITAIILVMGLGAYGFWKINSDFKQTKLAFESEREELYTKISYAESENRDLVERLAKEREINESFEGQIGDIADTVGVLEKLSKTDKELLQKYSKIYFLNENYIPSNLADIPEKYLYNKDRSQQIHEKVIPFLKDLIEEAIEDDIFLQVISSYRSFGAQTALKSSYNTTYGSGANQFSADQGYSEHQLGTTIDFTSVELGSNFTNFANDPAYLWLQENAHKYGFILSYPKDNAYYQFEPWHWRFVGESLARRLHRENKFFYDLDQREINEYLVSIFD